MAFTQAPTSVVLTDANGYEINLGGGSGPFTRAPISVVVTDKNGNPQTVGTGGTTINPTNNVLPKRSSATAFADSALTDDGIKITSTEVFRAPLGAQTAVSYGDTSGSTGLYFGASQNIFSVSSTASALLQANLFQVLSTMVIGFAPPGAVTAAAADTAFSRTGAGVMALGNGTQGDFTGTLKLGNETLTSAAPTVAAAQVGLGSTTATTATTGANGAPPAQVAGYLIINVAGTNMKIPYYNV